MGFLNGFSTIFSWGELKCFYSCHIEAGQLWLWKFCEIIFYNSQCVVWHTRVQPSLWGMRVVSFPDITDSDLGGHARMLIYIVRGGDDRHFELSEKIPSPPRWLSYGEYQRWSDSLQTSCSSPGCSWLVSHVVWFLHTLHS